MERTQLVAVPSGLVENVVRPGSLRHRSAEEFSPEFQVSFPYRGMFVWHVGRDDVVGDANQILFVTGGEAYHLSNSRPGGHAELIFTPEFSVLSELTEAGGFDPFEHPLFRARSGRATPAVQRACAHFLYEASNADGPDLLAAEEAVLALLRTALKIESLRSGPSAQTRRLIRRTKEFIESAYTRPLRLSDVADAVDASPAYLTDVFSRFEGVSLQRYLTQLRLARALIELPYVDDLTALALDLGFSSHSHFTLVFRRAFGCTPSNFRLTTREAVLLVKAYILLLVRLEVSARSSRVHSKTELGQQTAANALPLPIGFDGHRSKVPMRLRRIVLCPFRYPLQHTNCGHRLWRNERRYDRDLLEGTRLTPTGWRHRADPH
jgi:AraC-like DNA-binding protein